ncbi:Na+/H+ antiporter subunit A [Metabacillus sp. 84]|uniref:Na+/H+ antiporter subunit A n=1 Tax=unclassified Metabacillus TaxID=2675274 RepID=UPI003CEB25B1
MSFLHLAILLPFIAALFVPFIYKWFNKHIHTGWFVLILPLALFVYFFQYIPPVSSGDNTYSTADWIPSLGIQFTAYVDGLGLLFALLITGIGSLVVLYSIYYLSREKEQLNQFYVYLLLFMGAMLGIVLSDNMIVMYTFWELTSLSSFLLIGYWHKREKSRYGAMKSMMITVFGGLSMLGGFILLYLISNTFSIREMVTQAPVIMEHSYFLPAMLLILLGAFTKSAQFPFYIWLPDAMEAPTPVSAYLHSATMVKAGLYLTARFTPVFGMAPEWFWLVSGVGLITLTWASFNAVKQTDLKAILAFSTVSQLGLIMTLLGAGSASLHFESLDDNLFTASIIAAIFHLINHATFKGSLFMAAGIIDHETGTRDIRRLGGLMSFMPITFTISAIGAFSMAGLPPFNGFLSKEMFFTAMINLLKFDLFQAETWAVLFPVLAWVASVFTFIYSMIIVFKPFTGRHNPEKLEKKPHEAPLGMLVSPVILASLVVLFGIFPNVLSYSIIEPAAASIAPMLLEDGEKFHVHISHWHGFKPELFMTIGVIAIGAVLYLTLPKWKKIFGLFPEKLTLNRAYDKSINGLDKGSLKVQELYMTGFLRDYLGYIFVFIILMTGWAMYANSAFSFQSAANAPVGVYELVLAVLLIAGVVTILFARTRLTSIIALGSVGYGVSLFFVLFRAPDLALTQLVIETVSVALFLLCFYYLPELQKRERLPFKMANFFISLGVGTVVTLVALSANSQRVSETISRYFIENSYKEAGGKNMVNVILVDFRGFDTLFEITVLLTAALGIFAMVKLRLSRREET